jgi:DNA repair exonuclease SbcCD ATPase subunit
MIRYGLFGAKARRGPTSDYKSLDMSLMFEVNGSTYFVVRAKKEQLESDGEILAVGADAVNKKIIEILGFDLEVFDVVCAANQKESERLTRLTPAKRKELIDNVVGLTTQEQAEKACRDEAKGLAREAEALTRALVPPVEPEKPKGHRAATDISKELVETRELVKKREELQRIIDSVGEAPVEPENDPVDIETIEKHEQERVRIDALRAALEHQLAAIQEPTYTTEQLDEVEAYHRYRAEVSRLGPKPDIDEPTLILKEMLDTWDEIDMLKRIGNVDLHCPKCKHSFCPSHELPEAPEISRAEIKTELKARELWAQAPKEPKLPELALKLLPSDVMKERVKLASAADKPRLEAGLAALEPLPDFSQELAFAREIDRAWDIYTRESERHMTRVVASCDAARELKKLPEPKQSIDELQAEYTTAVVYENAVTRYEQDKQRFDELTAEIAEKQERADAFMAGARGLVEARRTLKAFLAPSLSRVASHLISQMTANSQRPLYSIIVDEDMNITADGQDVSTFNGAHATMINLALRLALGQVLVSRVFPVFIGDEIDSDADEANAQAIADALSACKDQVKQIVLISHKRLEGVDHEVML